MVNLLEKMGSIAGIGGLAIGVFLLLFREIIRKQVFPKLTKQQAYRIIGLVSVLVWSIAVIGIFAWSLKNHDENKNNQNKVTTAVVKKPFIESDENNEKNSTIAARTYNVSIQILPVNVNHGAQIRPHSVALKLHSGQDTQSLLALNYPVRKLFVWSPEISGDVILSIEIGNIVLTKKYLGRLGFPEFLREFYEGNRVFRANEFSSSESKFLKDYGIEFLSLAFFIHGAEPVMQYLSQ